MCSNITKLNNIYYMILTWQRFNESHSNDFEQIKPQNLGLEFRYGNEAHFNENDIRKIRSFLFSKWDIRSFCVRYSNATDFDYYWKDSKLDEDQKVIDISFWMPYKDIVSTKKYIKISSYKDEWFLLTDHPYYYKCDQIDGVIECLKTLLPQE